MTQARTLRRDLAIVVSVAAMDAAARRTDRQAADNR